MTRALLIGKEPAAELGYDYVMEAPYDAVVIGSLSLGSLLRFREEAVLEALARMLPFPAESLADLHLPAFLFVYNAAFRRAEYDSDRQTLTLYPSFSKGAPVTLS